MSGIEVVKIGGMESEDPGFLAALGADLATRPRPCIVVHGGGKRITGVSERLGLPVEFVGGLRRTTPEIAEVALWILGGSVNLGVCRALRDAGLDAVSLCGADGCLRARSHPEAAVLGRVGEVTEVDVERLLALVRAGCTPVLAPLARPLGSDLPTSAQTPSTGVLNVNADHAALAVALAVQASSLRFVSCVPGVKGASGEVLDTLAVPGARALMAAGVVNGGMIPKLESALHAFEAGIRDVRICGASAGPSAGTRIVGREGA